MDDVLAALADQHAELDGLLDPLGEPDWQRPSRCEGWSLADVVLHLAQTDEFAIASASGRLEGNRPGHATGIGDASNVDEGADRMVASERGQPGAAVRERWRTTAGTLRQVLAGSDPHARVPWVAGQLSVRTLATTRLAECWIHTGDVAAALGRDQPATDRLRHIARLAWRTLPYAFSQAGRDLAGPVAVHLQGPGGEAWDLTPDGRAATTVSGDALDWCLVAARRVDPAATGLRAEGPDAGAVLALVRTYA